MENFNVEDQEFWKKAEKASRRGKIMGGLLLMAIGGLYLMKALGVLIPEWVFTWKMLLIGIGVVLAVKHKFRHPAWIVLIAVGGCFLAADMVPGLELRTYLWPIVLIVLGLFIVFKPRRPFNRHWRYKRWEGKYRGHHTSWASECDPAETVDSKETIECTTILSGVKKNIITKNLKGGEITTVMGGAEINFMQADFDGDTASLEVTQVLGGTKLIVPAHWEIRPELTAILGGVEDKRPQAPTSIETKKKVLILTGNVVLGGIEITSY